MIFAAQCFLKAVVPSLPTHGRYWPHETHCMMPTAASAAGEQLSKRAGCEVMRRASFAKESTLSASPK